MHFARLFAAAGLAALGVAFVSPSVGQERPRVERFTIDIPAAVLSDLDERLARTRWPDQLPGTDWSYGADTAYLRELVGVLAARVRLARAGTCAESLRALSRDRRRHAHSLRARAEPRSERDPGAAAARLAEHVSTDARRDSAADGPGGARAAERAELPRRRGVVAGLRLLRYSDAPRRRLRDERRAHGEGHARRARLRALRRARQRLGRRHRAADGAAASRASHRRASDGHHRRGGRRSAVHGRRADVHRRGRQGRARARVRALANVEAADARAFAERLAGRPRGMDRREVPRVGRHERRRREPLQQGRADHEPHGVLGHRHGAVVGAHVLRLRARAAQGGPRRAPRRHADEHEGSVPRRAPREFGRAVIERRSTGSRPTSAATSSSGKSPSSSRATCKRSSAR